MTSTTTRLTAVQRDVLARLRDGWVLRRSPLGLWDLEKPGEASRHVGASTAFSLWKRLMVRTDDGIYWLLA